MQKKIAISLLVLVLLPVGLLGWLGMRMAHNEQQMLELQVHTLQAAQLKSVDDVLQEYFQTEQKHLLDHAASLKLDVESLRALARTSPQVRQVLVLGADNKRIFPPQDNTLNVGERQFIERTKAIWENPVLLSHSSALGAPLTPAATSTGSKTVPPPSSRDTAQSAHGWYVWHWNAELHQLFWWRDPSGRLIGFELSPVRVLSDITARLPATGPADNLGNANIRLINANGQIAYQWGRYQPAEQESSHAMLPLNHPLGSWKLEYYAPRLAVGAAASRFGMLAAILALTVALAGLAYYLYREQAREMRMAEQRVNFVNQVSHELKTPLTNIRMYAELLENELSDGDQDGKPRNYLAIINAESQRLSRLIANVLSFARAAKERLVLHPQPGIADDIIARCIEAFMPALRAKAIEVRVTAQAGALVQIDTEVLEQILNNLISNVEKYAACGAILDITSAQQGNVTTIAVRDFGPGIARREQKRIFQPFYRISSTLTDGVAGTGIGLSIARELARLHGGDLTLAAVPQGACFCMTLLTEPAGAHA